MRTDTTARGGRGMPEPTAAWDSGMQMPIRRTVAALALTAVLLAVLVLAVSSLFAPVPIQPR